jgi:uncharacterized coiled-coil protein SlyX
MTTEQRIEELTLQVKNQAEIITALEKELIDLYRKKAQLNQMITDLNQMVATLLAKTGEIKITGEGEI